MLFYLGLKGEHIRRDKGFYAVFPTPEEYTVLHAGEVLGSLQSAHQRDDHLLFAGRRWRVIDVDEERLLLHVQPAKGWKRPRFGGGAGDVHPRIRQKMREVLIKPPPMVYLDPEARSLFDAAVRSATAASVQTSNIIRLGPRQTAFLTWTGTRIQETLYAQFASLEVEIADEGIGFTFKMNEEAVRSVLAECMKSTMAPEVIAEKVPGRQRRKYDALLGDELLNSSIAQGRLELVPAGKILMSVGLVIGAE